MILLWISFLDEDEDEDEDEMMKMMKTKLAQDTKPKGNLVKNLVN